MGGYAEGLHHDLGPAPLSDLHVAQGSLADDHHIRLHIFADGPGRHALKALLMDHAGHINISGEIISAVFCEEHSRRQHGGQGAFHIRGAPAVHPAVHDLSSEGVVLPLGGIRHRHRVHVPVKKDAGTGAAALDMADAVSVPVHMDVAEAVGLPEGLHLLRHQVFVVAVTLGLYHLSAKRGQLFLSALVHHGHILPFLI